MKSINREMLKQIAQALGDLRVRVAFLGGSTLDLYAMGPAAPAARPTVDVDCIVEIAALRDFYALEDTLRGKGFKHDTSEGAPLCRWIYEGIKVDVMPTGLDLFGFTNEWYRVGVQHTFAYPLDDVVTINLLELPYFLATKMAALQNRGMTDLRTSKDFEDIVYVLRNRTSVVQEILAAAADVKAYLGESHRHLLHLGVIDEAITAVLDLGEPVGTQKKMRAIMEQIASTGNVL
jgi:predicted nucleotidyltransferase